MYYQLVSISSYKFFQQFWPVLVKINVARCMHQSFVIMISSVSEPGRLARLDGRLPGMRIVAGSILQSGNILSWRLVMK